MLFRSNTPDLAAIVTASVANRIGVVTLKTTNKKSGESRISVILISFSPFCFHLKSGFLCNKSVLVLGQELLSYDENYYYPLSDCYDLR